MAQHGYRERSVVCLMRADERWQGDVQFPFFVPVMQLAFINRGVPSITPRQEARTGFFGMTGNCGPHILAILLRHQWYAALCDTRFLPSYSHVRIGRRAFFRR